MSPKNSIIQSIKCYMLVAASVASVLVPVAARASFDIHGKSIRCALYEYVTRESHTTQTKEVEGSLLEKTFGEPINFKSVPRAKDGLTYGLQIRADGTLYANISSTSGKVTAVQGILVPNANGAGKVSVEFANPGYLDVGLNCEIR